MCSRVGTALRGARFATLIVLLAMPVGAQSTAAYRARVDTLARTWHRGVKIRVHADSVILRELPADSIRIGPLLVITDSGHAAFARQAATFAAHALEGEFGSGAVRLRTEPLLMTAYEYGPNEKTYVNTASIDSTGHIRSQATLFATTEVISADFAHRTTELLTNRLGSDFASWIRIGLPIDSATAHLWADVRVDMVTAPSLLAHECYAGDVAKCALALGVTGGDDPMMHWYSADERRQLIRDRFPYDQRSGRELLIGRCTEQAIYAACDSLISLMPVYATSPRLGFDARQSVVRMALALGGAGAYERMVAAPHQLEAQLHAASQVSTDSLMRAWRAQIMDANVGTTTMNFGTAAAALFWVGVCTALALRSSRWS